MSTIKSLGWIRLTALSIDERFGRFTNRYALDCLRYSLAVVFFWFGIIKPLGMTPATMLVRETLSATPVLRAVVPFSVFMPVLGWWEALVGLGFLSRRTIHLAVGCMMIQMAATFVPLLVVPEVTFHSAPFVPTTPGFYVVKNAVLLSGGLVVATSCDRPDWQQGRTLSALAADARRGLGVTAATLFVTLQRASPRLLRAGLCLVFLWAGMRTLSGTGEMAGWIVTTVHPLAAPALLVPLIGVLELSVGLCLLTERTTTIATYLVVVYLLLSLVPLLLQPALVFDGSPVAISFEGAYLIKDWVLVSAVLVLAGGDSDSSSGLPPSSPSRS